MSWVGEGSYMLGKFFETDKKDSAEIHMHLDYLVFIYVCFRFICSSLCKSSVFATYENRKEFL